MTERFLDLFTDINRRYLCWGILALFIVDFGVAHNLCWLNPDNRRPTVYHPTIYYGWEYNLDSGLEIRSAIDFPDGMILYRDRIARPLKNAVISVPITIIDTFFPLNDGQKIIMSYVLHHLMNFVVMAAVWIILLYLAQQLRIPATGVLMMYIIFLFHFLQALTTSHTGVFQVAITVFSAAVVYRLSQLKQHVKDSSFHWYVALYLFFCGFFILIKQDLAPFLALFLFALYRGYWKSLLIGSLSFIAPFFIYKGMLAVSGIEWYNHEVSQYGQGIWFLRGFCELDPNSIGWGAEFFILIVQQGLTTLAQLFSKLWPSLVAFVRYFGVVPTILAASVFFIKDLRRKLNQNVKLLIVLLLMANVIQTIAAYRFKPYMFSDSFIIVALLFGMAFSWLQERYASSTIFKVLVAVWFVGALSIILYSMIHFPWVHPTDQLKRTI